MALQVYSLSNQLTLDAVQAAPLKRAYTAYTTCTVAGNLYLAAYDKGVDGVDLYKLSNGAPWLEFAATVTVGAGWDIVEGFVFANTGHLMTYRADKGQFCFFPLNDQLGCTQKYLFYRNHAPGTSQGFTMVKPFVLGGGIVFMGYNFDTGAVAMYTLTATATSPAGIAPLFGLCVWDHAWAKGWTRFAFFALGGAMFFLKTNTAVPNVNIDHILDNPATGTIEVATKMNLTDAQQLSVVEPFYLNDGDPHFIAYRPDGPTVLYRIHSDCQGWSQMGTSSAIPNATKIVPARVSGQQLFLFFS